MSSISKVPYFARNNYWLNVLEINKNLSKKKLSKIIKYLNRNGIETRPIWYPNHLQQKYKNCQTYKLKNINKIYHKRLCLPSSMKLTFKQKLMAKSEENYQFLRKVEYPSIVEQLDMIYWDSVNNTTVWKDTIDRVKKKYPKDDKITVKVTSTKPKRRKKKI